MRVEGTLPRVAGDRERIAQLLANLIGNGLKYNQSAPPGGRRSGPSPRRRRSGTRHATLFVRDNGIGIAPQYHEQIFRLFRRLHRREEYEGTGAGLAICKKIVEAHGGRIWVESEAGRGATFYFTLPASLAAPPGETSGQGTQRPCPACCSLRTPPDVALIVERLGRRLGPGGGAPGGRGLRLGLRREARARPGPARPQSGRRARRGIVPPAAARPGDGAPARRPVRPPRLREDVVSGLEAGADYLVSKDLLARPEEWQARVGEILAARDGLGEAVSLSCQRNDLLPQPSPEVVVALNRALRHPLLRQLGSDVLRLVLRRAARERRSQLARAGRAGPGRQHVAASASPGAVSAFAAGVTEQLQRLLGSDAAAPAARSAGRGPGRPGG